MSKPRVAVVTESPDDCQRTWDAIEHIMEPLEKKYKVKRISVLDTDPKNGKAATKTEIRAHSLELHAKIKKFDYVVLVGNTPLQAITGKAGISKMRGKPIEMDGKTYLPMNNPGILRHDEKQIGVFHTDLKFLDAMIKFGGVPEEENLSWRIVASKSDVREMIEDLHGTVSYDIETTCLYPWQDYIAKKNKDGTITKIPHKAKVVSIGFGTKRNQWCVPVNHPQSPWIQAEVEEMLEEITEKMDDIFLVTQNGKFDLLWTWVHLGVKWENNFDTMLAHFLLDENSRHGLKYLAMIYCNAPDWEIDLKEKQGMDVPLKKHCKYLAHDVYYTRELKFIFGRMLKEDWEIKRVFDKIMMPCSNLFVEIEYDGVFIDIKQFEEAESVLRGQYESTLSRLKKWEPKYVVNAKGKREPFNWGSPAQLSKLLFEDLGIESPEPRGKSGNYSCSESVINRIDHPCTADLLAFRKAKQQLSFFIDGWRPFLHKQSRGWYLHPSFKLHGTVTGRLSCEHPNLQQVPRDPRIRSLISAEKGWTLIQCDLSQAELRIAAELARETTMIHAFLNRVDVHWLTAINEISRSGAYKDEVIGTACQWAKKNDMRYPDAIKTLLEMGPDAAVDIDKFWKETRKKAKAINFGFLYGMWWVKFKMYARDNYGVEVTDQGAQESREAFFDQYSRFTGWHKRQKRYARKHGYVKSLSGRKRRLPDAMHKEPTPQRKAAERQAINSPVQSFASEINLMAALQLRKEFGREIVKICGTVHDAVLFRVRNDWVERAHDRMMEIMRWPELMDVFEIEMIVPIEADGDVGPWGKGIAMDRYRELARRQGVTVAKLLGTKTASEVNEMWKDAA